MPVSAAVAGVPPDRRRDSGGMEREELITVRYAHTFVDVQYRVENKSLETVPYMSYAHS